MTYRNPLRLGPAVLLCTTLAACFAGAIGCDVYEDELLRRREDDDGGRKADPARDATSLRKDATLDDTAQIDGGATHDATPDGPSLRDITFADTRAPEETADSAPPDVDGGAPAPDDAGPDASSDGMPRDAIAIVDAPDASNDAVIGSRDADATTGSDGADDAPKDGPLGTDRVASDGNGVGTDADASYPPPTIRVVRVGDGAAQLTSASAPVFIEERRWDGSITGLTLPMPTTKAGAQQPFTIAGNATSEGALSLSLDGRYLTLAGYATAPGRAAIATSSDVDRVAAAIDASGQIDTSTPLGNAFLGSNVRSATSADGASFWIVGESGGVWYFPRAGNGAQVAASPDNIRMVALFADRLYGSSGASPMNSIFTVGIGRPTTGTQRVTSLAGMPVSGLSPYAFAFFDRTAVGGLDTLYLADDRSPENDGSAGGIQKWTFDGSTWTRVATFVTVGAGMTSFRGLAGFMSPAGTTLVASTSETTGNRLVVFVDDGSPFVTGTVIATAANNTIFRGVALSPHL